jgi:hypothetical protein
MPLLRAKAVDNSVIVTIQSDIETSINTVYDAKLEPAKTQAGDLAFRT